MLYVIKWLYMWILPLGGVFLTLFAILIYMFRKRAAGRWALLVTVLCFLWSFHPARQPSVCSSSGNTV